MNFRLTQLFAHPLMQGLSFSIILVGSPYFGGPYLIFVCGSFMEGYLFGILGIIGIVLTLVSLRVNFQSHMQIAGLLSMLASLAVFFLSSKNGQNASTMQELVPLVTLALFVVVCICVIRKLLTWKNY